MAKLKKAQLGALVKAGVKALSKAAPEVAQKVVKAAPKVEKAIAKSAETPLKNPKLSLIGQNAKRALGKSVEKRTNPSKKLSYEDQVLQSYQKNGGVTKSMKMGGKMKAKKK